MIHWLVQSTAAWPGLAAADPPPGLLAPVEVEKFRTLLTDKRRREWLLGRWTAKRLLQTRLCDRTGQRAALDQIIIASHESGAPYAQFRPAIADYSPSLSLSHAGVVHGNAHALCAVVDRPHWPLGADIEQVVTHPDFLVRDYFTAAEGEQVSQAGPGEQDERITAIWSAKEAALKAVGQGLKIDTRAVTCRLEQPPAAGAWASFAVTWDRQRLEQPAPALNGLWRRHGPYVLTLATARRRRL